MRDFIPVGPIESEPLAVSAEDLRNIDTFLQKALNINEAALAALRRRISDNRGLVRIFVHPFYTAPGHEDDLRDKHPEASAAIERGAERHIASASMPDTAPLLLFEEEGHADSLSGRLLPRSGGGVYVIPTQPGQGTVSLSRSTGALRASEWFARADAQAVHDLEHSIGNVSRRGNQASSAEHTVARRNAEILRGEVRVSRQDMSRRFISLLAMGLGIRSVVIGGMYLRDDAYGLSECLGDVIPALRDGGAKKISLSRYVIDPNGNDIHGIPLTK